MKYQRCANSSSFASCGDVLDWAEATGGSSDAVYELKKVPARMGMADEDIGLIPADLAYFDGIIAKSPYGMVSKSKDLGRARQRGNSRVRALFVRFHASRSHAKPVDVSETYDRAIEAVKAREGFVSSGADFTTSTHKALFVLRARCRVPLDQLDQAEVDRVFAEASPEKRRAVRRAVNLLNKLLRGHNHWPDMVPLLPPVSLAIPKGSDRAERILWSSLPEGLRTSAEAAFREALLTPTDLATWIKEQMKSGLTSTEINQLITERVRGRGRRPKNSRSAVVGYQGAVTWLARQQRVRSGSLDELVSLRALMSRDLITSAIDDQIARSNASDRLKDASKSQTLANRLMNLRTIARHGLCDREIVAHIDVLKVAYHEFIVTPKEMTKEADYTCRMLQNRPDLAAKFVNAPADLARQAEEAIAQARAAGDEKKEDLALRLYAAAVLHAIQTSRPLRTSNLMTLRYCGTQDISGNLVWIEKERHAELRFVKGEIKNDRAVTVHLLGADASILWTWMNAHRKRFLELRGLPDSSYVFPGRARPRFVKDSIALPDGCMSPSTMAEVWALGDTQIGLGITPHACRHAIATLILAVEPGNFAKAAAVLGDTEETVRRHYGRDSGEQAAKAVRAALLERHPDIFKRLKGRVV